MFFDPPKTPPPPENHTPPIKIIKNHKNPLSPPYDSIPFPIKSYLLRPPPPLIKLIKPIKLYFYPLGFPLGVGGGWVGSRPAIEEHSRVDVYLHDSLLHDLVAIQ
jgi:hypothetical protein